MYEDEMYIYFVMEHCTGGDLLKSIISTGINYKYCKVLSMKINVDG